MHHCQNQCLIASIACPSMSPHLANDSGYSRECFRTWVNSAEQVQEIGSQQYLKRLVNHDNYTRAIAGHISAVTWSIDTFVVSLHSFLYMYAIVAESTNLGRDLALHRVRFGCETCFASVLFCYDLSLTAIQDTRVVIRESSARIEGKLDNIQRDIKVCQLMCPSDK